MEQLPLFQTPEYIFTFDQDRNHKLRLVSVQMTMWNENFDPFAMISWVGHAPAPKPVLLKQRLVEAFKLRFLRPYGDEYDTPDGRVRYLDW